MNNTAFETPLPPAIPMLGQAQQTTPFVGGRAMVTDALALAREFGADAVQAASLRSAQSRQRGNIADYCKWREVERLLSLDTGFQGGATRH
ncbi:MAG: hypothetical protein ABL874_00830 [Sphingopyxis sp.]